MIRADLTELKADDARLNAVADGRPLTDPVSALLTRWREEVDARPLPPITEDFLDDAVAAVHMGHLELQMAERTVRRRRTPLVACAVLAIAAIAGMSGALESAGPGDTLWPAAQVLHTERAASVQAAYSVSARLDRAKRAIAAGRPDEAQVELNAAAAELHEVKLVDGQLGLLNVQSFLAAKTAEQPLGVPLDPGAPLQHDPTRPVPIGAQLGVAVPWVPVAPIVSVEPLPIPAPIPAPPAPVIAPVPVAPPPVSVVVEPASPPPAEVGQPEQDVPTYVATSSPTSSETSAPTSSPSAATVQPASTESTPSETPVLVAEPTATPEPTIEQPVPILTEPSPTAEPSTETVETEPTEQSNALANAGDAIAESAGELADEVSSSESGNDPESEGERQP